MTTLVNPARERMQRNQAAIGLGIRHSRHPEIASALKTAGFDFLFIDLEHSSLSLDDCSQIAAAAIPAGIAPLVRVPEGDHTLAGRALDTGALGIVMPHVETAAEARAIVQRQKYAPLGARFSSGPMPQFAYAPVPAPEARAAANAALLIVVQVESETAVANADEIAAVPGIDVVMIGTGDLTAAWGLTGQPEHARVLDAYDTVIGACARHGKWAGMGGVTAEDAMGRYIRRGVRFVLGGNDLYMLLAAATRRVQALRGKEG